jgi:hypothetical protein
MDFVFNRVKKLNGIWKAGLPCCGCERVFGKVSRFKTIFSATKEADL